ncbi:MAG: hypothetical protein AAF989_09700, partial [Planctomycetota bacterium]
MTQSPPQSAQSSSTEHQSSMIWFALTTLLSAFLVFQVQPVISKCVLPWFGGTPAVWTTCMLFFQVVLFSGYAYAHLSRTFLQPAMQGAVHLGLLCAALLCLPIEPSDTWKPNGDEAPAWYLLCLLGAHIGLPYFVLSSTGPLIQAWLSYRDSSDRVYRLYALSNIGSLSALLSYPFLIEPWISLTGQSTIWSMLFCLFVLAEGWLAVQLLKMVRNARNVREGAAQTKTDGPTATTEVSPTWWKLAAWIGLPAFASASLLVVTNHVCQDIAVIPFLWVLPLSLYLLSFIICFDSPRWYRPKAVAIVTLAASTATLVGPHVLDSFQLFVLSISYLTMLMGVCLLCHGEVARLKPPASRLTLFYMCMSGGGALGGFLIAVACPFLFNRHTELPIVVISAAIGSFLLFYACREWGPTSSWKIQGFDWSRPYRMRYMAAAMLVLPGIASFFSSGEGLVMTSRNFFGVLKVTEVDQQRRLVHGSTFHGRQWLGENSLEPTSYYGHESGVGLAMKTLQSGNDELSI